MVVPVDQRHRGRWRGFADRSNGQLPDRTSHPPGGDRLGPIVVKTVRLQLGFGHTTCSVNLREGLGQLRAEAASRHIRWARRMTGQAGKDDRWDITAHAVRVRGDDLRNGNRYRRQQAEHTGFPLDGVIRILALPAGPRPSAENQPVHEATVISNVERMIDVPASKTQPPSRPLVQARGERIEVGLPHAGKTAEVTAGTDTYQITAEDGIIFTAPRRTSRDIKRHKDSNYGPPS
jgi:hypothetical protein